MNFDFIYEDEWREAGVKDGEMHNARTILKAVFSEEFLTREGQRSQKMAGDVITRNYLKHPLLVFLESPFTENVYKLLHLVDALTDFKDSPSIADYISRLKKQELFKAALFELEFASFLLRKGIKVIPSFKIDGGEVDIFIPNSEPQKQIYLECKTYKPRQLTEENRRNLFASLMKMLPDLPTGFVICFKSYVEITDENLKPIKNRLKQIIKNAPEHYQKGEDKFELFFGELEILYFRDIDERVIATLRRDFNEVTIRTLVPKDELKRNMEILKNPTSADRQVKYNESVLACDLPLTPPKDRKKIDYLEKAKSDIKAKVDQHKKKLEAGHQIGIILENIPSEDFIKLKSEIEENSLYSKYPNLSILFVEKYHDQRELSYKIFPAKNSAEIDQLVKGLT